MITSMSRSELYRTLIGHDNPFKASSNSVPVKKAVPDKITEIPENVKNTLKENALHNMKNVPAIDISKEPNIDRLVLSDAKELQSWDIRLLGNEEIPEAPYEASDAIDFMDPHIQGVLRDGYDYGLPTKERIAEYFGDIAKRLDEAYAEGKFTKDEYDELNEMILNQVEKQTTITENKTAFYALGRKRYSLSPEAVSEIVQREKMLSPEERLAAREQEIRDYAERYCKIDRAALMKLFNSIRFGK